MRVLGRIVGFAALLSSCAGPTSGGERAIEIVLPTEIATLDPRFSTRGHDVKTTRLIHAGLVGLDADTLEPIPLAAKAWTFVSERTLELELRPGVRFQSGKPLEAADVCATLKAIADPALGSPHRAVVKAIGSCTPLPNGRLRLELEHARATLLTDLEVPILREDQARLGPRPLGDLDGLGPYRVQSATPSVVELEPADTGLVPKPRHALVIRSIRDENARALRLLAGRADIAPNALSPTLLPSLDGRAGLTVRSRAGANVSYLLFQNDRPPFDRPEVRRAIGQAIDRERIVRTLLAGRGETARGLLPRGHWAAPASAVALAYDPAAAKAVLSSLPPVTLVTSTDRLRLTIARAMAQMLGDAGLEVRVVSLDFGVLLARLDSGDFEMATLQMPELTEPNVLSWFFHPRGVPGEGGEGKNRARYRDADVGRWLDDAGKTRDLATRRARYGEIATSMARDLPVLPLWHEDQVAVVSERAAKFSLSAEGRWLQVAQLP
ncbi:MAG: ABC transporter substrate-binding protein [Myxococcales bacterium]|nr:ABC transporter substrate-binding protein [Myxococcales bacterium]